MNLQNYFALLLVLLSCLMSGVSSRFRIFNGQPTWIGNRPYMVSVHDYFGYFCAGSLVNLETVITAAHCLRTRKANWVTVKAGGTHYKCGESRKAKRLIKPSTFNEETLHMDVAAIKLCSPFTKSSKIQAIPLCSTTLKNGDEIRFSGWGYTRADSTELSAFLRTTVLEIISMEECASIYKKKKTLTSAMICGRGEGGTCPGDSGAPGVVNGQICTVLSAGRNCGDSTSPGIYTNLNYEEALTFVQESMTPELEDADTNQLPSGTSNLD